MYRYCNDMWFRFRANTCIRLTPSDKWNLDCPLGNTPNTHQNHLARVGLYWILHCSPYKVNHLSQSKDKRNYFCKGDSKEDILKDLTNRSNRPPKRKLPGRFCSCGDNRAWINDKFHKPIAFKRKLLTTPNERRLPQSAQSASFVGSRLMSITSFVL